MWSMIYDALAAAPLEAGYKLWALKDEKAREYFAIRKGMFEGLSAKCAAAGCEAGGAALFHVASVGELLQAMPVMAALKERGRPFIALSYTSPSVSRNLPRGVAADVVTPSPLDRRSAVRRFLDLVRPRLIVFSTYDLWPGFTMEAAARNIPLILVNASLPENSGRLRAPAGFFYRRLYSHLLAVGAITDEDGARFKRLGVPAGRVRLTGNCRFDQTLARCRSVAADDPDVAALPEMDVMMIAGSTWPEDLDRLLPALANVMERRPEMGAVIAPHEPSPDRVAQIERFFGPRGMSAARFTELKRGSGAAGVRVVVVDTVGVLYKLYKKGAMAYVGGGFRQGVHNVMEPAGMGLPVIVGPVHKNSAEALEMIRSGGAVSADGADAIEAVLAKWAGDPAARKDAGARALEVVEKNAGATGRTVEMVEEFLT